MAISIPVIVAGSKLVLVLLTRFPAVVLLGGMLIGWIAGSMLVSDLPFASCFPAPARAPRAGAVGALLVLFTGWRRRPRPQAKDILSTAPSTPTASSSATFLPVRAHLPYALY